MTRRQFLQGFASFAVASATGLAVGGDRRARRGDGIRAAAERMEVQMTCDLCDLAAAVPDSRRTRLYHEDGVLLVCDCETCRTPMIVFKAHRAAATAEEVAHAEAVAKALGMKITRRVPRRIRDHVHFHARRP